MPYGVLKGQILRFLKLTNSQDEFFKRLKCIYKEYIKNGFESTVIVTHICKAIVKYENKVIMIIPAYNRKKFCKHFIQILKQ